MIASIKGKIDIISSSYVVVDVNGVGYKILLPFAILSTLSVGKETKLFTYTHVREDVLELYGFLNQEDLKLFEHLISVSGVGPKTAIGIFSSGSSDMIIGAISRADVEFFTSVPRLGKKNAQKIIIELKSKLGSIAELDLSGQTSKEDIEIIDALKNFGFTSSEIKKALKEMPEEKTFEERIKAALKYLGK
ncbi:MAG: Holliday junction branch migration protein RuvA [bacterium]|nr:Holliday junction branch migration protein RuvA [bacterium]